MTLNGIRPRPLPTTKSTVCISSTRLGLLRTLFALIELDESEEYGEDRFLLTGRAAGGILVVVYTERGERIRIISAREATEYERRNYYRAAQED
jgi:uncharacterized DUF497 family protein